MPDVIVYLVTYEGQKESPYTNAAQSFFEAEDIKHQLTEIFPEREYSIWEKDVS